MQRGNSKIRGYADLPLHGGKCPKWLFPFMKELSGKITEVIVDEYGQEEFLRRISDPYWFQAFGSVIGFDWHSSGLTTTTTGALKEALNDSNLGIFIAGGKGKASRKTISQIQEYGDELNLGEKKILELQKASRISAKVDNSLIQDGYSLYHHSFFITKKSWSVVQQGMNESQGSYARRYHWLSDQVESFVSEPHSGIISNKIEKPLNLIDKEIEETRKCSVDLIKDNPRQLGKFLTLNKNKINGQTTLFQFEKIDGFRMSGIHFPAITADMKALIAAYERQPGNYQELLEVSGMGAKNLRALALISHLVHGTKLSWKDPVRFSFAHGGKDGWPYPVNKERYKGSIDFLKNAINEAKIGDRNKYKAMKRLYSYQEKLLNFN